MRKVQMGNFSKFDGKGQEETFMAQHVRRFSRSLETCIFQSSVWKKKKRSEVGSSQRILEDSGSPRQLLLIGGHVLAMYQVPGLW